jgi:NAD(P)-dependent dehydrogenase (short-subunit alcohol dehydrogenase family)|tara:strand:- start:2354 stop:3142 length:789 start_codon:yes stop_codon:yes gene_type:complete
MQHQIAPSKSIMKSRFENQVAVITGGANGLGKAIGMRIASEGGRIVIFDRVEDDCRSAVEEFTSNGYHASFECVDVSKEPDIESAMKATKNQFGKIDIVVNCAGVVGPTSVRAADVDIDAFDQTIAVNLRGSFLILKHALRMMEDKNYGRILLIASIAGKEGNAGMCSYSASKAGVIGLVKSVGKEYAETGITVNALAPAVVKTAMTDSMLPDQVKYMTNKIPMQRLCTLEEVASAAAWIVSPEASFNTAYTFDLSGGRATY